MDNSLKSIVIGVLAFIAGMFIYSKFFVPEFTTTVVEKTTTDTVYREVRDTVFLTKIKHSYQRDTIILTETDTIRVPLQSFSEIFPVLYGNVSVFGEVAGKLTKMAVSTDFDIPTITNTVTKETRTVIKPSGLYGTLGARAGEQQLSPIVGATYLKDKALIFYNYDFILKSHQAGIGVKILGK